MYVCVTLLKLICLGNYNYHRYNIIILLYIIIVIDDLRIKEDCLNMQMRLT